MYITVYYLLCRTQRNVFRGLLHQYSRSRGLLSIMNVSASHQSQHSLNHGDTHRHAISVNVAAIPRSCHARTIKMDYQLSSCNPTFYPPDPLSRSTGRASSYRVISKGLNSGAKMGEPTPALATRITFPIFCFASISHLQSVDQLFLDWSHPVTEFVLSGHRCIYYTIRMWTYIRCLSIRYISSS